MSPKDKVKRAQQGDEGGLHKKGILRDYWETICVVLIFVLFARTWVFQNSNIPSGSMKDTLQVGDRLLVNSFVHGPTLFDFERQILPIRTIQKGEIIVFKFPGNPQVPFIKRVIGKEGDVVQVVNQHLFVNGVMQLEGYVRLEDYYKSTYAKAPQLPPSAKVPDLPDFLENPDAFRVTILPDRVEVELKSPNGADVVGRSDFGPYRVPKGHLFAMGDNRMNSEDSRYWGALDERMVLGRAWVVWWSFKEGDMDYLNNRPGQIAKRFLDKFLHFFGMTRWDRILMRPK